VLFGSFVNPSKLVARYRSGAVSVTAPAPVMNLTPFCVVVGDSVPLTNKNISPILIKLSFWTLSFNFVTKQFAIILNILKVYKFIN
jgi:hypothetical protein